jgi:ribosomal protein S18 acetylase RimI-like enzyme
LATAHVRRLAPDDAEPFRALRLAGLAESPEAFGSSPDVESEHDLALIRSRLSPELENATFGAFDGERLIGVLGLVRPTHPKGRHRGQIWGMYVDPAQRRAGVGRALVATLVDYARGLEGLAWLDLGVGVDNAAARSLYEAFGFRAWGIEPDALRVDGRAIDEAHMSLELRR